MNANPIPVWLAALLMIAAGPATACGWWGDGEGESAASTVVIGADGTIQSTTDDPADSPIVMVAYGDRFRTGVGVPRDYNVALRWYRLAAQRGYVGGQYNLARMIEHGMGTQVDMAEAARWYLRAAAQGEVHSQHHLAAMYREGRGVPRDLEQSSRWLRASAEQGHRELFPELARAYELGRGLSRDPALAYQWWWLAAREGDAEARRRVGDLAATLPFETVEEAERLGRERLERWALPATWSVPDLTR